ncbi:hypothetical protein E4631_23305 [Hymenobacter sp. UV11]|uniref:hypothetical protein n=1 Tax=Hymenobacter sp. UV11 TaxID=1849735 RepID=UPI001062315F|nr:hypothetical protein [Hymenobacter sp. UV11]TDN39843.1 hypothetical protein A8B98_16765 [Hymenobacter sp. UV11]TFZ63234.1 hypothetical protein E4631_23305 [Hymenobacter sp. UV11]
MQPITLALPSRFKFGILRKAHLYEDVQGHNVPAILFFLSMSILAHCFLAYVLFAGFVAVWIAGVRIASEKRFLLLSALMWFAAFASLWLHGPLGHE